MSIILNILQTLSISVGTIGGVYVFLFCRNKMVISIYIIVAILYIYTSLFAEGEIQLLLWFIYDSLTLIGFLLLIVMLRHFRNLTEEECLTKQK